MLNWWRHLVHCCSWWRPRLLSHMLRWRHFSCSRWESLLRLRFFIYSCLGHKSGNLILHCNILNASVHTHPISVLHTVSFRFNWRLYRESASGAQKLVILVLVSLINVIHWWKVRLYLVGRSSINWRWGLRLVDISLTIKVLVHIQLK